MISVVYIYFRQISRRNLANANAAFENKFGERKKSCSRKVGGFNFSSFDFFSSRGAKLKLKRLFLEKIWAQLWCRVVSSTWPFNNLPFHQLEVSPT
jgi:hypothetical protein